MLLTGVYGHVSGEVVVGVEDLPTLLAGISLLLAGGETGETGQTLLRLPQYLGRLWEGKCWEPEVLWRGEGGGKEGAGTRTRRYQAPPGVPRPQ